MSYTLQGWRNERQVEVTWDEGQLSGDPVTVELLQMQAEVLEGREVGPPTGPWTLSNHLASALSTVFLFRELCEEPITGEGDLPEPPRIPRGAVS